MQRSSHDPRVGDKAPGKPKGVRLARKPLHSGCETDPSVPLLGGQGIGVNGIGAHALLWVRFICGCRASPTTGCRACATRRRRGFQAHGPRGSSGPRRPRTACRAGNPYEMWWILSRWYGSPSRRIPWEKGESEVLDGSRPVARVSPWRQRSARSLPPGRFRGAGGGGPAPERPGPARG